MQCPAPPVAEVTATAALSLSAALIGVPSRVGAHDRQTLACHGLIRRYIEVYMEKVRDLLSPCGQGEEVKIRQHQKKGFVAECQVTTDRARAEKQQKVPGQVGAATQRAAAYTHTTTSVGPAFRLAVSSHAECTRPACACVRACVRAQEVVVSDAAQLYALLKVGDNVRTTAATNMNAASSRSHGE
jgi:hypothetical protein